MTILSQCWSQKQALTHQNQEKKMSHDVQCWQATEEAKRHAEEQLAEVTSNYQEMSKKLAKSLHLSKTVEKLENELSEANATIQVTCLNS